jgi:amino acid adenylation domain-containing protein/non-ribosomal peptide synthase protein (TIGR01720 family)
MPSDAAAIIDELRGSGVTLWSDTGRLRYRAPEGVMTEALKRRLATCRAELMQLLSEADDAVRRREGTGPVSLTPGQMAIWAAEQSGVAGDAFHIPICLELSGRLDKAALTRALDAITHRHEALRARVMLLDDRPHLTVEKSVPRAVPLAGSRGSAPGLRFDLEQGPLWRATLTSVSDDSHNLTIVLHHLIADGGSIDVLLRDLAAAYDGATFEEAALGCTDVAAWAASADFGEDLAHWRGMLAGAPAALDLLPDRSRPPATRLDAATERACLGGATVAALRALAAGAGTTLFAALWTLFAMLLSRAGAGEDIVMAAPVLGRARAGLADVVGLLTNRVALRADLSDGPSFRALLDRTGRATRDALAHAEVPFELVTEAMAEAGIRPDYARVLFALQNAVSGDFTLSGLSVRPREMMCRTAKADLYLAAEARADALDLVLEYPPALFDQARMAGLLGLYVRLAAAAAAEPDAPIGQLPLMDADERAAVLASGVGQAAAPSFSSIVACFEDVAARFADRPALTAPESWESPAAPSLSYAALNAEADGLAACLTGGGAVIAVALPRSGRLIVALLGILKSGAAYLPLDPDLPPARAASLAAAAGASVLVTDAADPPGFAGCFARVVDAGAREAAAATEAAVPGGDLAYVLFTSGSTGTPKGVAVTHANVLHFVAGLPRHASRPPVFLHFAPVSFDASVMEIFGALLTGACLLVAPAGLPGLDRLGRLIRDGGVTFAWLTAGLFHRMIEADATALCTLDHLVAGGDALSVDRVRELLAHGPQGVVANGYGPTETTVLAAYHVIRPDALGLTVPIGRPLGATRLYVLDARLEPVPPGLPGELWIGGPGVAAGYIGQAALTAERFLADPFAGQPGARMYRSGDRARWRADGTLEYLGRLDQQVKLRGFRIEPGEIECALRTHAEIADAAVAVTAGVLVAYVVPAGGAAPSGAVLAAHLAGLLPDHMVPRRYVPLAALPLTASGKLDRRALPVPQAVPSAASGALAGPAEQALAAIWCALLRVDAVAPDAHFFELGGDSIMAMQVAMRAAASGWRIAPGDVLRHHTIRALATVAVPIRPDDDAPRRDATGAVALTPIQHFFFAMDLPRFVPWNQAVRLVLDPAVTLPGLRDALEALEAAHPALRLRFPGDDTAMIVPAGPAPIILTGTPDALHAGIDLAHGPVWRALWLQPDPSLPAELLLTAHHLVIDGVSWRILLDDLAALLRGQRVPPSPADLHDWSRYLAGRLATEDAAFWLDRAPTPPLRVPPGEASNTEADVAVVTLDLDPALTAALLGPANSAWRTTPTELLLAGLCLGYGAATSEQALLVDLERHGRDVAGAPDLSRTVGWFTSIAPVALRWPADAAGCAAAVKRSLRAMPDHGIGFLLLRHLGPPDIAAALGALPRASVSVNYLGQVDASFPDDAPFRPSDGELGAVLDSAAPRPYAVEIVALCQSGRLRIDWRFGRGAAARAAIAAWAAASEAALRRLAEAAATDTVGRLSAADFPLLAGRVEDGALTAALAEADCRPLAVDNLLPLAPQQAGVLMQTLAEPGAGLHVEQILLTLRGRLDPDLLRRAWEACIARFPALRTAFLWSGLGEPIQVVLRDATPEWIAQDWSAATDGDAARDAWLAADRVRGFAPARAPLLRLALFRTGPDTWLHGWSFHHILLDGWSVPLVLRAVMDAYAGLAAGHAPHASAAADASVYLAWLAAQDSAADAAYWRQELAGLEPAGSLPDSGGEGGFETTDLALPPDLVDRLGRLARVHRLTMNTVVQGAWACVLAASGRPDPVFGATVSGRPASLPGSEAMVGLFINSVPLRARPPAAGSVLAWLSDVQARAAERYRHEHCTAGQIHAWSGLPASAVLFDTLLVFENYPLDALNDAAAPGGIDVIHAETIGARTTIPIVLLALEGGTRFRLIASNRLPGGARAGCLAGLARMLDGIAAESGMAALLSMPVPALLPPPALPPPMTGRAPSGVAELGVARLFQQVLGPVPLDAERNFFELGGHSLLGLELLRRWRETFGSTLSLSAFLRAPSVAGLASYLTGGPAGTDVPLIALSERMPTLFLAPGAGGNPFAYRPLAQALGPAAGLVAFEPDGLLDAGDVSIEALGAAFAAAVGRWQPVGRLHLAGHSLGAAIAYQAALDLRAAGRDVAPPALIDLPAPGTDRHQPERDEAGWLADIADAIGRYFGADLGLSRDVLATLPAEARQLRMLAALAGAGILPHGADPALIHAMLRRYRRAFAALAAYRPRSSQPDLPVRVVRGAASEVADIAPDLGWGALCRVIDVAWVPGDHISMIAAAQAGALAKALQPRAPLPFVPLPCG